MQNAATEDEINEVVTVAMTIGTHKMKPLAGKLALPGKNSSLPIADTSQEGTCFTGKP
jgi:hypothetical protein